MKTYGLIGFPLSHSFSKGFFADKFVKEGIADCNYESFPLPAITDLPGLISNTAGLSGLNVTIPYKETVIPYLDELDAAAMQIGAVNCIRFTPDGRKVGYNTDVIGFRRSLEPLLKDYHTRALVLGTGGAAKAVQYVLDSLQIPYQLVSRKPNPGTISYYSIDDMVIATHTLIINTTPLGMYPNVNDAPELPYELLSSQHLLYDLVYNPEVTTFLKRGAIRGATTKNGYEMLVLQAEASWDIWNEK
jgi:shikimate dehydrogenase